MKHIFSKKRMLSASMLLVLPMTMMAGTATPTLDSGNTAWITMATILVMLMTIPGLALFYGGLEVTAPRRHVHRHMGSKWKYAGIMLAAKECLMIVNIKMMATCGKGTIAECLLCMVHASDIGFNRIEVRMIFAPRFHPSRIYRYGYIITSAVITVFQIP